MEQFDLFLSGATIKVFITCYTHIGGEWVEITQKIHPHVEAVSTRAEKWGSKKHKTRSSKTHWWKSFYLSSFILASLFLFPNHSSSSHGIVGLVQAADLSQLSGQWGCHQQAKPDALSLGCILYVSSHTYCPLALLQTHCIAASC